MDLLSSVSVYVGKTHADIELDSETRTFEVEVPRNKDGNNDLLLTLKFNQRVYVRFSYQNRFIDLVGYTIQFSGFDDPYGVVQQFNLSRLGDIRKELSKEDQKRALSQIKTLKAEIFRIKSYRDCKVRRGVTDWGRDEVDGGILTCDGGSADHLVAYTNGQKSRINYVAVDDEKDDYIETFLFNFVAEKPSKFVF